MDRESISKIFISIAENNFNFKIQSLQWYNELFGLKMQNGLFRYLNISFDCFSNIPVDKDAVINIQNECIKIIYKLLEEHCYDLLLTNDFLLSLGFINYPPEKDTKVRQVLESAMELLKNIPYARGLTRDIVTITCGLSQPFENLAGIGQARKEAMEAVWMRFSRAKGKIIEWEMEDVLSETHLRAMDQYKRRLKKACSLLDLDLFDQTLKSFFSLPKRILANSETRAILYDVELYMYEVNRNSISKISDLTLLKRVGQINTKLSTMEEYLDHYSSQMESLFKEILKCGPKSNKLIREAENFVRENIAKDLRMSEVADQIGLNAVYFSHLFKKLTGIKFTDYVLDCKIQAAKTYLTQDKIKIEAIAANTGFSDSKYFSKKFKEKEGLSPSEYRKLYS